VTTPPAVQTATFGADADARVEEANPLFNFGSDGLGVDGGTDPAVESYLRFTVTGVTRPVISARLRVFAAGDTIDGPAVFTTTGDWSETGLFGITWSNRPARASSAIDDSAAIATNSWIEFDVTTVLAGHGSYDFVLAATSEDEVDLLSREQPAFAPQLVVTF
jgi:hypothetical protein